MNLSVGLRNITVGALGAVLGLLASLLLRVAHRARIDKPFWVMAISIGVGAVLANHRPDRQADLEGAGAGRPDWPAAARSRAAARGRSAWPAARRSTAASTVVSAQGRDCRWQDSARCPSGWCSAPAASALHLDQRGRGGGRAGRAPPARPAGPSAAR